MTACALQLSHINAPKSQTRERRFCHSLSLWRDSARSAAAAKPGRGPRLSWVSQLAPELVSRLSATTATLHCRTLAGIVIGWWLRHALTRSQRKKGTSPAGSFSSDCSLTFFSQSTRAVSAAPRGHPSISGPLPSASCPGLVRRIPAEPPPPPQICTTNTHTHSLSYSLTHSRTGVSTSCSHSTHLITACHCATELAQVSTRASPNPQLSTAAHIGAALNPQPDLPQHTFS